MTNEDFYYLFSGENRQVCDVILHQPRVRELIKYDIDVDKLIQPFFAFVDLCDMEDGQKDNYRNLDLIFHDHVICEKENCIQNSMLKAMVNTLIYLCRNNNIEYDLQRQTIKINDKDKINRYNFDELQSFVLSIFYAKKPKPQKITEDKKQRSKVLEMQKKMAAHRKKKELQIPDIVKVVQNGDGFIDHNKLLDFTYWQLMDRYSDILKVDAYRTHMDYKLSPKYELKDADFKHWTEDIKITTD